MEITPIPEFETTNGRSWGKCTPVAERGARKIAFLAITPPLPVSHPCPLTEVSQLMRLIWPLVSSAAHGKRFPEWLGSLAQPGWFLWDLPENSRTFQDAAWFALCAFRGHFFFFCCMLCLRCCFCCFCFCCCRVCCSCVRLLVLLLFSFLFIVCIVCAFVFCFFCVGILLFVSVVIFYILHCPKSHRQKKNKTQEEKRVENGEKKKVQNHIEEKKN